MSYFEISEKLNIVSSHLQSGNKFTSSLCRFLRSVKSSTDTFSGQLSKHLDTLSAETKGQNMDTLSAATLSFIDCCRKIFPACSAFSTGILSDIVEPLELFADQYNRSNQQYIERGKRVEETLAKERLILENSKQKYFQSGPEPSLLEKAKEEYTASLDHLNSVYEERDKSMKEIMNFLQKSEESRINFIKKSFERYSEHFNRWHSRLAHTLEEFPDSINNINSRLDTTVFVDINKTKPEPREEFIPYEEWKKTQALTSEELISKVVDNLASNDSTDTEASLNSLENEPNSEEYSRLSEILAEEEGRVMFIDCLLYTSDAADE